MSDLTVDDVDFLLKRDWFLDMNDINNLIWDISEQVFLEIWERRWTYPPRARDILGCDRPDEHPRLMKNLRYKMDFDDTR